MPHGSYNDHTMVDQRLARGTADARGNRRLGVCGCAIARMVLLRLLALWDGGLVRKTVHGTMPRLCFVTQNKVES
jgi:hypothetical protein